MSNSECRRLYVVATPIGNLEDISSRGLRVLQEADYILAEDTRVTKKLLSHFAIHTPIGRLDAATEARAAENIAELFEKWKTVALATDAGTPALSDPGSRFVAAAHEHGIGVVAVPGPSAVTAALSIAGLPADHFTFVGFPPQKKGRETFFDDVASRSETVALYESPHRFLKTLASLAERLPETRTVAVARELTKVHEELRRGSAQALVEHYEANPDTVRGEFVILIGPAAR